MTIQFESHRVELAGIYEMEHDARSGVFRPAACNQAGLRECRREADGRAAHARFLRHPPRGSRLGRMEDGRRAATTQRSRTLIAICWERWPRGVVLRWAYAERWGFITAFALRQRSTGCFSGTFSSWKITCGSIQRVRRQSRNCHRVCVGKPRANAGGSVAIDEDRVTPDDIFGMIAAKYIYVDLRAAPLAEPSRVAVFLRQKQLPKQRYGARQPPASALPDCSLREHSHLGRPHLEAWSTSEKPPWACSLKISG